MSQRGQGFAEGDVVLILDLSFSPRQPPFPALGVIHRFLDNLKGQVEIRYNFKNGRYSTVNRPLSLISNLVSATEKIPEKDLLFDPLIMHDYLQEDEVVQQEGEPDNDDSGVSTQETST